MVDREPVATSADPIAMVLGLGLLLERLGLPGELAASRRLLKRSEVLGEAGRAAQMAAGQRRAEATRELLAGDGEVDTEALAVVVRETDVWLAFTPGDPKPAPAMGVLMDAARMARGHAGAMLTASAPGIYPKLQRVAAETVAATAALPKLPAAIWSAPDPALVAVREGHAETLSRCGCCRTATTTATARGGSAGRPAGWARGRCWTPRPTRSALPWRTGRRPPRRWMSSARCGRRCACGS